MGLKRKGFRWGRSRLPDTETGNLFDPPPSVATTDPEFPPLPPPGEPASSEGYVIRRSARARRIRLRVNRDGSVEVVLPLRAPLKGVDGFVKEHEDWIQRTRERFAVYHRKKQASGYAVTGCVMFRGRPTEVVVSRTAGARSSARWDRQRFHVSVPDSEPESIAEVLASWMRAKAPIFFRERIDVLNHPTGYAWKSLRVADQKTRWGSCSTRGTLSFNWRLLLAPPEVLDYVVIHELAHLREPNHSAAFWKLVAEQCPDYKRHILWLKENGASLVV